jgi:hypothetical protein
MAHRDTWETYAAAWKLEEAEARLVLSEVLSADCNYCDPLTQTRGLDELLGYMKAFRAQLPGGSFVTTGFESHTDRSLTHWEMLDGQGHPAGVGTSFGTYGPDGRLTSMTGFFATQS